MREMAVKALPAFGPTARGPSLKPLLTQLSIEKDPGVRMNIILILGAIGADKPEEAKPIVDALNVIIGRASPGSPVRLHATRALAPYGAAAAIAIPTLINIVEDPAWETRQAVAYTLARAGRAPDPKPDAKPSAKPEPKKGPNISVLRSLTSRISKEECALVRLEMAQSLLLLGPPGYNPGIQGDYEKNIRPFLELLEKQIAVETDPPTHVWLMMTHMTYDARAFTDVTISKIADYINKPDVAGRIAALRALALLGKNAKPALPSIISSLKWTDPDMIVEGISALAALKELAKEALPELERLKASGPDAYVKNVAGQAIDIINGKPPVPKK